jgi:hypothetical protein
MKNLLRKEIFLSLHPTAPIFLILSMMLMIPNYPYYVVFFYTGMAVFIYITIAEACANAVPYVRDYLDTKDPQYLAYKLIVLIVGAIVYVFLTYVVYRKSIKSFEALYL